MTKKCIRDNKTRLLTLLIWTNLLWSSSGILFCTNSEKPSQQIESKDSNTEEKTYTLNTEKSEIFELPIEGANKPETVKFEKADPNIRYFGRFEAQEDQVKIEIITSPAKSKEGFQFKSWFKFKVTILDSYMGISLDPLKILFWKEDSPKDMVESYINLSPSDKWTYRNKLDLDLDVFDEDMLNFGTVQVGQSSKWENFFIKIKGFDEGTIPQGDTIQMSISWDSTKAPLKFKVDNEQYVQKSNDSNSKRGSPGKISALYFTSHNASKDIQIKVEPKTVKENMTKKFGNFSLSFFHLKNKKLKPRVKPTNQSFVTAWTVFTDPPPPWKEIIVGIAILAIVVAFWLRRKKKLPQEKSTTESFEEEILSSDPYYDSAESTKTAYLQQDSEIEHLDIYRPPQRDHGSGYRKWLGLGQILSSFKGGAPPYKLFFEPKVLVFQIDVSGNSRPQTLTINGYSNLSFSVGVSVCEGLQVHGMSKPRLRIGLLKDGSFRESFQVELKSRQTRPQLELTFRQRKDHHTTINERTIEIPVEVKLPSRPQKSSDLKELIEVNVQQQVEERVKELEQRLREEISDHNAQLSDDLKRNEIHTKQQPSKHVERGSANPVKAVPSIHQDQALPKTKDEEIIKEKGIPTMSTEKTLSLFDRKVRSIIAALENIQGTAGSRNEKMAAVIEQTDERFQELMAKQDHGVVDSIYEDTSVARRLHIIRKDKPLETQDQSKLGDSKRESMFDSLVEGQILTIIYALDNPNDANLPAPLQTLAKACGLRSQNVNPMDPFIGNDHRSVGSKNGARDRILEIDKRGFFYKDKLIKKAQVIVGNGRE